MVLAIIEKVEAVAFEMLVGIPESVGLLAFGIGLVAAVVVIRRMLTKTEVEKSEERFGDRDGKAI